MNQTPPLRDRLPEGVVNLADYERLAEQHLDPNAWAYFSGGAGDEVTVRWNREAFDRTALMPRMLNGGIAPDTRAELLGHVFPHPILVAGSLLFHGRTVRNVLPVIERMVYLSKLPGKFLRPPKPPAPSEPLVQIETTKR